MTSKYAVHWPVSVGILPDPDGLVHQWQHSIVRDADFCSVWAAAHRATELALQFGCSTFHPPAPCVKQSVPRVGRAAVTFSPMVEVLIGAEDSIRMAQLQVPAEVLGMPDKPWSNAYNPSNVPRSLETFQYDRDLGCPIECLFEGFVASRSHGLDSFDYIVQAAVPPLTGHEVLHFDVCSKFDELDVFTKIFISDPLFPFCLHSSVNSQGFERH